MPFFGVPFFEQKINFGVSFLVKSQVFMGCHFRKITLLAIDFDQISLTWDGCHNLRVYIFNAQ